MNCGSKRPSLDFYYMAMAHLVSTRSTCLRRVVGCVLVDEQGRVLSTGYNGVARGELHCNESKPERLSLMGEFAPTGKVLYPNACPGANSPSGVNLEGCAAIHAEQNALVQCRNADDIHTCYVTVSPCDSCLKLFMNTGCVHIKVGGWYAGSEMSARKRWENKGRTIQLIEDECPF